MSTVRISTGFAYSGSQFCKEADENIQSKTWLKSPTIDHVTDDITMSLDLLYTNLIVEAMA